MVQRQILRAGPLVRRLVPRIRRRTPVSLACNEMHAAIACQLRRYGGRGKEGPSADVRHEPSIVLTNRPMLQ
jgi:hypothetical protein